MKIIVLVKQVPDTTEMKIDKETGTLIRTGIPTICNPDDLAAIEEALTIKEQFGAHVHVMSMGPQQAETMMRELLGMGVDEATLITDRAFAGSDTWATSNTIAEALKSVEYDLILAGRQAIDETIEYVKSRKQFGRPISAFQNTQFKLADLQTEVDAARYLVYRAAVAKDTERSYGYQAAQAKLFASKTAMHVTVECLQLFGGYGYTRDYPIERMMRDAKITEIYEGTSEVQRMVIAGSLLR